MRRGNRGLERFYRCVNRFSVKVFQVRSQEGPGIRPQSIHRVRIELSQFLAQFGGVGPIGRKIGKVGTAQQFLSQALFGQT